MHTVYILHSKKLNKNYAGYTSITVNLKLKKHNSNHKGFTGKANDWMVVWNMQCFEKREALILERKIKKRGIERYLDNL